MLSGDSAPHPIFHRASQACPCWSPAWEIVATFNIVFSLKITPTGSTLPLGSLEAHIPLKSAFLNDSFPLGSFTPFL